MFTNIDEIVNAPHLGVINYTQRDFKSNVEVRWCPGCGMHSILGQIQKTMPELNIPKEKLVFVSGIGCSSRFPYYMENYGFHSIHGRAIAIASGLKVNRPDLNVWVSTGDGDNMSIGGNHFIHACRRNVDLQVIMFNNQIYSLTKGQFSPTSQKGQYTKSTPLGNIDNAFNPTSLALGSGATFVARGIDKDVKQMRELFERAYRHTGMAFVEVYANCIIFNDGAFDQFTRRETRWDNTIFVDHGKPMIFGSEHEKGIILDGYTPKVVNIKDGTYSENDLLVYDEKDSTLALITSNMTYNEVLPRPLGVFYANGDEKPSYDRLVKEQIQHEIDKKGVGNIDELLLGNDFWEIKE